MGTEAGTGVFFFGTLMDAEVRDLVLERCLPGKRPQPAILRGFRRVSVRGRTYPMLLAHAHGRVEGLLVDEISAEALHRLRVFEGPEYHLVPARVEDEAGEIRLACVFLSDRHVVPGRAAWLPGLWQRRHKKACLREFARLMRQYGIRALLQGDRIQPMGRRPPRVTVGRRVTA